jgi:general L-amino acid transport system permease protein
MEGIGKLAKLKKRRIAYQVAALALVAIAIGYFVSNTLANLEARRIASGFGFLGREAGFEIGESAFLRYSAADSYLRALGVGLANTLTVAAIGILLATGLGTAIGLFRLSNNNLLRGLCVAYVEFVRNVPLLVQLFFWYALITEALPPAREALQPLPGVFLSNRGIFLPSFSSVPELQGFNFTGGVAVSPEFAALLIGLVVYTAGFIAEIVRAGVLSIRRGQWEAAQAIGLTRRQTLRHVVLPQALRVIVPPLTSTYLDLTKNSSLAVAIGYPDLVSIANTTMNQTGQAIEGIVIIMAVYLTISLSISALMNWYNARVLR